MYTLLAVVATLLYLGAPAVHDVLVHPSFEEVDEATGLPVGWQPWSQPSAAAYSLADARTGVACASILDLSPQQSHGLRSEPVRVQPGVTYRASAWTKILGGERPGAAVYLEFWRGSERIENRSQGVAAASDWTQIAVKYAAPADAQTATVLIYSASSTVGHSLFDDAALEALP